MRLYCNTKHTNAHAGIIHVIRDFQLPRVDVDIVLSVRPGTAGLVGSDFSSLPEDPTMAVHFGRELSHQHEEQRLIEEALRTVDPSGVGAQEMRWYVSGDEPTEGTHVYVAMKDDGTVVVTAFSAETLAERILKINDPGSDDP